MASFANRVALITGAGSGLGRQLALTLAGQGAAVAGIDLQEAALRELADALAGRPFAAVVADVTDRSAVEAAVARLRERLGPIDLLIACAGIGRLTPGVEFSAADFEAVVRVNLLGVANTIAAVLPEMLRRRSGQLAAISSLAAYRGLPRMSAYCASKAGVNALLDALRVELKGHGIAVTTICPGFIRTPMTAQYHDTALPMMDVADAARQVAAAIFRRLPFFAFPPPATRSARLMRLVPRPVSDWLAARHGRRFERIRRSPPR